MKLLFISIVSSRVQMTASDSMEWTCCTSRYYDNLLNEMLIMSQYPVLTIPNITTLTQYFYTNMKNISNNKQPTKLHSSSYAGIHGK